MALTRQSEGQTTRFLYKDAEVASYVLSEHVIAPEEKKVFERFLLEATRLHPAIVKILLETGRVPAHMTFAQTDPQNRETAVWVLQSFTRDQGAYPLAPDFRLQPLAETVKPLADVLPLMLAAQRGESTPRTLASYRVAITDALARNAGLEATLLILEAAGQFGLPALACGVGETDCRPVATLMAEAQRDKNAAALITALGLEANNKRPEALELIQGISRDGVTSDYALDDTIGNMLNSSGQPGKAYPLVLNAMRGNPHMANYYKDLGDVFRSDFNPFAAWICYDLGRALPVISPETVVNEVTNMERSIAHAVPQFF